MMKQKKNIGCRNRAALDLVMQKIRINTYVDANNVNAPFGVKYLCKMIGYLFGIGLCEIFPSMQFQTTRHMQTGDSIDVVDVQGITKKYKDSLLLQQSYNASSPHMRVICSKF